jgi:cbb3-type cytochrome oxidase subunit 1
MVFVAYFLYVVSMTIIFGAIISVLFGLVLAINLFFPQLSRLQQYVYFVFDYAHFAKMH